MAKMRPACSRWSALAAGSQLSLVSGSATRRRDASSPDARTSSTPAVQYDARMPPPSAATSTSGSASSGPVRGRSRSGCAVHQASTAASTLTPSRSVGVGALSATSWRVSGAPTKATTTQSASSATIGTCFRCSRVLNGAGSATSSNSRSR